MFFVLTPSSKETLTELKKIRLLDSPLIEEGHKIILQPIQAQY